MAHIENRSCYGVMLWDARASADLSNPQLIKSQHDYLRQLHQGNDPLYTSEFQSNYDEYFGRLAQIVADSAG